MRINIIVSVLQADILRLVFCRVRVNVSRVTVDGGNVADDRSCVGLNALCVVNDSCLRRGDRCVELLVGRKVVVDHTMRQVAADILNVVPATEVVRCNRVDAVLLDDFHFFKGA